MQLSSKEQEQLARRYTQNAEAYRLYLKGYYSLYKFTPDGLMKSFDYFNRAIASDPDYALAYAGLVEAYFNLSFLSSPTDVWTKAAKDQPHVAPPAPRAYPTAAAPGRFAIGSPSGTVVTW